MAGAAPIRKRMRRAEVPGGARFVTFSCQQRLMLLGREAIRAVFIEEMGHARERFRFELFAWVVMPEHVHLLVRPRSGVPLARVLLAIKLATARRVLDRWPQFDAPILKRLVRRDGSTRFWQKGGGFDRNARDDAEFSRTVRYIHRNPVERGLVERAEDWQASSVRWWMGLREGEVVCDPPPGRDRGWEQWTGYK